MRSIERSLRTEERKLTAYLWGLEPRPEALPGGLRVVEMSDGGMGSLSFVSTKSARRMTSIAGECSFFDVDGVSVEAALLLDEDGDLFELDMWKVDFSPLIRIPDSSCFSPIQRAVSKRDGVARPLTFRTIHNA